MAVAAPTRQCANACTHAVFSKCTSLFCYSSKLMKSITGVSTTKPFSYNWGFPGVNNWQYWFIETKTRVFIQESDG